MKNNTANTQKFRKIFNRDDPNMPVIIILLAIAALISVIFAIGLGPVSVAPGNVARILGSKIPFLESHIPHTWTQVEENIVWGLRFPRVLLGLIVGSSLSMTGVAMQALVRNHLADPFILGVSSGAAATATLGMLFGAFAFLGTYSLSISAFLGAAITIILVYTISRVRGRINITQLLLSGVALSMIMDAVTRIITLSAPNALGLHNVTFWLSGSLAGAKWGYLTLPLATIIICLIILLINYRALNALLMGDETAGTLGFNVARLQKILVLVASLMAGTTLAVSGTIGFVGLMVPHMTRLLVGADHKRVLPVCALLGGILVVWVDVAARMLIAPEELPLGILTAVFGGPFFIWLLKHNTGKA
ncbi:FecCD family ABC transporter permease [Desulfosporosinus meridiei]|uniref:ABC-type Fe3+-siderophore transport system, permease component n=1 Tax=Desulfosporosinus meridiei (strain ATCC BAA-275 / DSM 13257 / KCTC 12902 / NCIMB 13706 / S10) TaxID=768704 RepID=J7ILY4_DESMD|nr:iron ABC transporter permease [Desulfosporosinus meridiei]AFQ42595.1 ABC-type Fe3+-siderophore transport system, permease component [Desulfosporosinus meridiei DSM 13257]